MRKEMWTILGLAFVVVVLNIIVTKAIEEPRYRGEPFAYWFAQTSSPEEEIRAEAFRALGVLQSLDHPRALSTLTMRLEHESSPLACAAGIQVLGAMDPETPRLVPLIVSAAERMKSPVVDKEALRALCRFPKSSAQAAPFVTAKLRDDTTRKDALETIRLLGKDAAPVAPALVEIATSPIEKAADLQAILEAFLNISRDGTDSPELAKVVETILAQPETGRHVVLVSAVRLSYYLVRSSAPKAICDKLSVLLDDPAKRDYALDLLVRLEDAAMYATPRVNKLLFELVESEGEEVQKELLRKCAVAIHYGTAWRDTRTVSELLLRLDRSKPAAVRKRAVYCLSILGSRSRSAFTSLQEMRAEEGLDPDLAALIDEALRNIAARQ